MPSTAEKRLMKERDDVKRGASQGHGNFSAAPLADDDLFHWNALIEGREGTPLEGGLFRLDVTFPRHYPFEPPKIKFKTNIYHPNVDETGHIHMDILADKWSPAITLDKILISLIALLSEPDIGNPQKADAMRLYLTDREAYEAKVRDHTRKFASAPPD